MFGPVRVLMNASGLLAAFLALGLVFVAVGRIVSRGRAATASA
jgi:hypothetical protein